MRDAFLSRASFIFFSSSCLSSSSFCFRSKSLLSLALAFLPSSVSSSARWRSTNAYLEVSAAARRGARAVVPVARGAERMTGEAGALDEILFVG